MRYLLSLLLIPVVLLVISGSTKPEFPVPVYAEVQIYVTAGLVPLAGASVALDLNNNGIWEEHLGEPLAWTAADGMAIFSNVVSIHDPGGPGGGSQAINWKPTRLLTGNLRGTVGASDVYVDFVLPAGSSTATLALFDLRGRRLAQASGPGDLYLSVPAHLPSGVYFMRLSAEPAAPVTHRITSVGQRAQTIRATKVSVAEAIGLGWADQELHGRGHGKSSDDQLHEANLIVAYDDNQLVIKPVVIEPGFNSFAVQMQNVGVIKTYPHTEMTNLYDINALTFKLLQLSEAYQSASPREQQKIIAEIKSTASTRNEFISSAIRRYDYSTAEEYLFSKDILDKHSVLKEHVESYEVIEGTWKIFLIDYFDRNLAEEHYFLITNNSMTQVYPQKDVLHIASGSRVRVEGYKLTDIMIGSATVLSQPTHSSAQERRLALLLVNFEPNPLEPYTLEHIMNEVFISPQSTNAYFQEVSFNKITFTGHLNSQGDVFGYYTLSSGADCANNFFYWSEEAKLLAIADGFDVQNYEHVSVIFFGAQNCGWAGLATMPGTRTFINGLRKDTLAHELGHNLGLRHASAYSCWDGATRVSISSTCTSSEYGDLFDVMGTVMGMKHFNAFYKTGLLVPVIPQENVIEATEQGIYTIHALEREYSHPQLLKIPRSGISDIKTNTLFVEVREQHGFDNFPIGSPALEGVLIRIGGISALHNTYLIDANPSTTSFNDAPLLVGETLHDPIGRVYITLLSRTTQTATVQVTFRETNCLRKEPLVTITSPVQPIRPGTSTTYTYSVTNRDSIGCESSQFNMDVLLPSGLGAKPASNTFSLQPQAVYEQTITIMASKELTIGSYDFEIVAENLDSGLFGANSASLNIYSSSAPDIHIDINK